MYREYFGMTEKPFSLAPDPRFLLMTPRHKEALAHLLFGMTEEGGFVLLTGEVGTGKTTLCRTMLEQVPDAVDVALVLNPKQTSVELLASICDELGAPYPQGATSPKHLTDVLNRHLLDAHAKGRRTVLIVDEAQNLDSEVLEQVRLLTNLETTREKLLQIILIGQPELKSLMSRRELRQLAQRITARCHLTPLTREETAAYIRHRLEIAGAGRPLFTPRAIRLIHRISGGIPRLINIICERALLGAYAHQRQNINRALVRTAASEVLEKKTRPLYARSLAWAPVVLLLVAVGLGWRIQPWFPMQRLPVLESMADVRARPPAEAPIAVSASEKRGPHSAPGSERPVPLPDPLPETLERTAGLDIPEPMKTSRPEYPDLRGLLLGGTVRTDTDAAFGTLFGLWGEDHNGLPGKTACEKALAVGLRCLHDRGNWTALRHYGRPAILELIDQDRQLHDVVAVGLNDEEVTLDFSGLEMRLPRRQVEPFWYGDFVLLWRPPPLRSMLVRPGSAGPDVLWLRERLRQIDGADGGASGRDRSPVFDEGLRKRVLEFQRARALEADGMVGEKTLIQLTAAGNSPVGPLLKETPGPKNSFPPPGDSAGAGR